MIPRLLKSFKEIFNDEENLKSYYQYYNALCNWINNNKIIGLELKKKYGLDMLMYLDLDKYNMNEISGVILSK